MFRSRPITNDIFNSSKGRHKRATSLVSLTLTTKLQRKVSVGLVPLLTEHRTNPTESLSKHYKLRQEVAALCNLVHVFLTVPGEFVHKEANSEAAEEKAKRRDHNDEGYFANSRSYQILEKKLVIFYCIKTTTKNITNQIRTVSNVYKIRLRTGIRLGQLTENIRNFFSVLPFFIHKSTRFLQSNHQQLHLRFGSGFHQVSGSFDQKILHFFAVNFVQFLVSKYLDPGRYSVLNLGSGIYEFG
jgi:hypothetical protein